MKEQAISADAIARGTETAMRELGEAKEAHAQAAYAYALDRTSQESRDALIAAKGKHRDAA